MGEQIKEKTKYKIGQPKNWGIVAMPLALDFGASHQIISLEKESDFKSLLGYNLEAPQMILLKEAFKRARKILVYRLNSGTYATYETSKAKIIARYQGKRGNDISIHIIPYQQWKKQWGQVSKNDGEKGWGQVSKNDGEKGWGQVSKIDGKEEWGQVFKIDGEEEGEMVVVTFLGEEIVDLQIVTRGEKIRDNDYVRFEGDLIEGELVERQLQLSGGENYEVRNKEWEEFFDVIHQCEWRAMAVSVEDIKIKRMTTKFIQELRESEGKSVYAVMANYSDANCTGVISIANGVKLSNGMVLKRNECTAWMAGMIASARLKDTYEIGVYEEAMESDKKLKRSEISKFIKRGEIVFNKVGNKVMVVEDINTFKMFTPKWSVAYQQNAFVRVVDIMKEDFHRLMKMYYLGSIRQGKSLQESKIYFKEICTRYIETLQAKGVLYEVDAKTDLDVFFSEGGEGVDVSLILKSNAIEDKTYVSVPYNKLIS